MEENIQDIKDTIITRKDTYNHDFFGAGSYAG